MEEKDLKYYAKVHSVESFGTVDGPGIRFVLFLQGCHLQCKYCHNRDTWDINGGTYKSSDEIFSKIMNYKNYIYPNGGVTITGGEPLLQTEFITELFKELKNLGYHTAIDTSGALPISESIKELLKYTDLVLLDIKHINPEKCVELTGYTNKNTLEFAKYLSNINIPVWIRQVLVPGYTDDKFDLIDLKKFIATLSNVEKVELLPYHNLGKFKWKEIGVPYELENVPSPTLEEIEKVKNLLEIE